MLIFYEQNNLHAFKQIFINQYEFAVKEYFWLAYRPIHTKRPHSRRMRAFDLGE
jgi:hypothetical protein